MNWDRQFLKDTIIDFARPFTIYASGIACSVGVFFPHVDAEKLLVLAGLAGGVGYMHGQTKVDLANADTKKQVDLAKVAATGDTTDGTH